MDGPCLHRSRSAAAAKQKRVAATVFRTDHDPRDTAANALCQLLHALSEQWTERQFESLIAFIEHGTEATAARALGVSQPTLHQSLARSRGKTYLDAREALFRFLETCPAVLHSPTGRSADA
ncbi:MAG TPA: LysR family transcriptional regulator [Deferrisomatales bacterium]|nr:LysR family transcriptional regulator [Deferrisomatales bacterium]